ncbi:MAG TPA: SOS response-associated peptidase [Candidatus Cloacimonas sp.]|nr:SOS response-associated peptidase [Candidatus Cloacimonas sp.]
MCGRFAQVIKHDQLKKLTDELKLKESSEQLELNYNVAPTQTVSAVIAQGSVRYLGFFRWGLIPSWMKAVPEKALINVRCESILEKPSFKVSFLRRRCLVPVNGFYEWRSRDKQPFFFHSSGSDLLYLAGIYDAWYSADGSYIPSLGIITQDSDEQMADIHSRMPVSITKESWDKWLDPGLQEPRALQQMLQELPAAALSRHPVSKYVNSPANQGPQCWQPLEPEPTQSDIFA